MLWSSQKVSALAILGFGSVKDVPAPSAPLSDILEVRLADTFEIVDGIVYLQAYKRIIELANLFQIVDDLANINVYTLDHSSKAFHSST